jgi:HD-GYP domain-containing protein (c-di-GMP phosphodiesterase class II)
MLPGIELHHESLDGRGYPYGLKGDQIPDLPRVIAVADTFDALTTNRPYQNAYDPVQALAIIHSLAGKRLDPRAVAALTAVYERGEIRIQRVNVQPSALAVEAAAAPPPATVSSEIAVTMETSRF